VGNYDSIQVPTYGQPISASQFGVPARDAIVDLDRRVSAFDGSTGIQVVASASSQVLATTAEVSILALVGFTFRGGFAYRANIRQGLASAVAGTLCNFRIRKSNASGTDYGEYFRAEGKGASVMSVLGSIYLLRSDPTDLNTSIVLTGQSSVAAASAITCYANATSPRYLVVEPVGFAADYAGMGVAVT
jgi:hypothetical protein